MSGSHCISIDVHLSTLIGSFRGHPSARLAFEDTAGVAGRFSSGIKSVEDASSSWVAWPSKHIKTDFERMVLIIRFIEYVLNKDEVSCLCKILVPIDALHTTIILPGKGCSEDPLWLSYAIRCHKCPSVFAGLRLALSSLLSHRKYRAQSVKALPR